MEWFHQKLMEAMLDNWLCIVSFGVGSCRSSTGYAALQFQTGVSKAHAEKEGQF